MPMLKHVYICGDSFGATDSEYGVSWVEKLAHQLKGQAEVVNLCRVCASNVHIGLQVDRAIKNSADYIIYLATSSVREDARLRDTAEHQELLDRFIDITNDNNLADLTSYSTLSLNETTRFSPAQLTQLKQYALDFFDLDLAIARNELIIEGVLARLTNSNIPYVFDQGGFEHPSFGATRKDYFDAYKKHRSEICVWDYVDRNIAHRPYYHIEDHRIHEAIADYYYQLIKNAT
jgi:hypothetical protein